MVYKAIGIVSGSLLDGGLHIVYAFFHETAGKWSVEPVASAREPYPSEWEEKLLQATNAPVPQYLATDAEYGHYMGSRVNAFIQTHQLYHQVHLVAFQGYAVLHYPEKRIASFLGQGAALAAATALPVVSDIPALDIALGGHGGPLEALVPLLPEQLSVLGEHKDATIIALLGVLRWREEYNVVQSVTGASRSSIGGALWLGGEA